MQIEQVGMTRAHYEQGRSSSIKMVVLHATAGRYPGDYGWLRQGGSSSAPVSIHYYIRKNGDISQMVDDEDTAWHAGRSTWVVDGQRIAYNVGCNPISLGIELENLNDGRDPYPPAQYEAALWLVRKLVADYGIPRAHLVRHLDIAPQRKTDPRGFAWEQFVAAVYAAEAAPAAPAPAPAPAPKPAPELPAAQLRDLLVDLAYRAAHTSCPAGWPLLRAAVSRHTGMPVVAITPDVAHDADTDAQERAVRLPGQGPLVLEAYGRDLFYAPPGQLEQVATLSSTPDGLLRDTLLHALFRAIDPAHGFQPQWAFHQHYLKHLPNLGVPISPNHRIAATASDGRTYACQHFALDTLCSPVDDWQQIIHLSELSSGMYEDDTHSPHERELRTLLLNDLYQQRTGRRFDPSALFCQYAITHQLGAPLGKAEYITIQGQRLVAMPYALDVLYCRVPANDDWRGTRVHSLPDVLGNGDEPLVARLGTLLEAEATRTEQPAVLGAASDTPSLPPLAAYAGALFGRKQKQPVLIDLVHITAPGIVRPVPAPALLILCFTPGPAAADLATANSSKPPAWHYYIDQTGTIYHLLDERCAARAASRHTWNGQNGLEQRALVIAAEGSVHTLAPHQRTHLIWLLGNILPRYGLTRHNILTSTTQPQHNADVAQQPTQQAHIGTG
jgi:N-acetyl-anhydromuramyl-L-alanine amidase AmpD